MAGQVQTQPASQKQWKNPDKSERQMGSLKRVEEKKKEKPKTATAGGGAKPPSKPPKGPTGGPNKGPKDEGKRNYPSDEKHKGGLQKGKGTPTTPSKDKKQFKREESYNTSLGKIKKK
jgi:hypothetical protein